ncbi:MAG: 3D domain-containing protein [Desulfuromonadales bacterium]|nr:3D domain-containing protein [Desulfuromonadales bacterium]
MKKDTFLVFSRSLIPLLALILAIDLYFRFQPETACAASSPHLPAQRELIQSAHRVREELDQALELLATCFGHPVALERVRTLPVTLTAYSSTVDQCDSTPHITASQQSVRPGVIAVSDDLVKEMGLRFGQKVLIPGHGIFEVQDRMHSRWQRTVDIWISDRKAALLFGKRQGTLLWVVPEQELAAEQHATLALHRPLSP